MSVEPATIPFSEGGRSRYWAMAGLLSALVTVAAAGAFELARPGHHRCGYLSPVDGSLQPYHLYIPDSYDPRQPTPVVFSLHGFGGRTGPPGHGWRGRWADVNCWLLVRPDGRGSQNWDGLGEDDFFHVLADLHRATPEHPALNIDGDRIYVEGGSMGGHGAFRLATRHAGRVAAVAPAAGWTSYREFYAHWYDAAGPPKLPGYVDPARLPLLETASSLWQAENALWSWAFVTFDLNDHVNPPQNAWDFVNRLRRAGSVRVSTRIGERGHCGSTDVVENFHFFRGKTREAWPRTVLFKTNTVRYPTGHWVTVERLRALNRWARIEAHVEQQQIRVKTANVLAFSLDVSPELLDVRQPVSVRVDEAPSLRTPARGHLGFVARLDASHAVTGWVVRRETDTAVGRPRKSSAMPGPLDDAFRSRFLIIYGAQPGSPRAAAGRDRQDAQRFATDWNAWMTLHWRSGHVPAGRRETWWLPPYPFQPGHDVPREQVLVTPRPDTDFTLATLPRDRNLVLFGDPDSNWIIARLAGALPLRLHASANANHVDCAGRMYHGDHVNYLFIAPNPMAPEHYVVVSRGYLSSRIDPTSRDARQVGKDLEALPFYWPDYVIWDERRDPGPTVQAPLRYLPDTFIEAGYFTDEWRLQKTPPAVRVTLDGGAPGHGAYRAPVTVRLQADDVPGCFGVKRIEYRIGTGRWTAYGNPFQLHGEGQVMLSARAQNDTGQYVYSDEGAGRRGVAVPGIWSPPVTVPVRFHSSDSLLDRVRDWLRASLDEK